MEVSYPIKREFIVYEVHFLCDVCDGHMVSNNTMLTLNPPLFPHVCSDCNITVNLTKQYPCIEYGC